MKLKAIDVAKRFASIMLSTSVVKIVNDFDSSTVEAKVNYKGYISPLNVKFPNDNPMQFEVFSDGDCFPEIDDTVRFLVNKAIGK